MRRAERASPYRRPSPDFVVDTVDGQLELLLNGRNAPDYARRQYREMIEAYKRDKKNKESKEALMFIKQKLDGAKWFIDAIKQRQHTLLTTMGADDRAPAGSSSSPVTRPS